MADTALHSMTQNTDPQTTDELYLLDNPSGAAADNRITVSDLFKIINQLTADSSPARAADYVATYDASASGVKKVLLNNLGAYTLQFTASTHNPADSTTYYIGPAGIGAPTTTASYRRLYIPRTGIITKCYIVAQVDGTLGTTENTTVVIRLNNTSDTTVTSTLQHNAVTNLGSNTAMTTAVTAGDYIEVKITTPGFATNPTTVTWHGTIFIE